MMQITEKKGRDLLKIGYRTIKTAIGTALAIYIAQLLNIQFFVSAGILTILCIKPTKKRSFQSAWQRFAACLIGLGYAAFFFEVFGYHPFSLALLLLFFIPTTVQLKIKEGIITSSVIILHVYTIGDFSLAIFINEILLIIVGIGVALLMNLYMPSREKTLQTKQEELEALFQRILREFAVFLRDGESHWDGNEMLEASRLIKGAKDDALKNIENKMMREEDEYYRYFKMREKQFEIIERVLPIVSMIDGTYIQGERIAAFLEGISEGIHSGNTAKIYLTELEQMKKAFKDSPLPKDRQEFETRSLLFYFLQEMEQYLLIKRYYKASDV